MNKTLYLNFLRAKKNQQNHRFFHCWKKPRLKSGFNVFLGQKKEIFFSRLTSKSRKKFCAQFFNLRFLAHIFFRPYSYMAIYMLCKVCISKALQKMFTAGQIYKKSSNWNTVVVHSAIALSHVQWTNTSPRHQGKRSNKNIFFKWRVLISEILEWTKC